MDLDFEVLFKRYLKNYPLHNNEQKLLFIVLSIPPIIKLEGTEMAITREIRKKLDYIFKTEELIKNLNPTSEDK